MRPITEIADWMGIDPDHVSPYGKYKAKLSLERHQGRRPQGQDDPHHGHHSDPGG